jgi:hypothetical protein
LGELQFTIGAHSRLTKLKDPADAGLVSDLYGRTKTLLMELERSRAVARIFLSSEAVAAIDEFEHEFQQPLKGDTGDAVKVFSRATERLTSAAKDELGLK